MQGGRKPSKGRHTHNKHTRAAREPPGKENSMKTWYCVTSSFDDKGRVTANITNTKEAEECPESTFKSTSRKDIYNDWFGSEEEAKAWIEESKKA